MSLQLLLLRKFKLHTTSATNTALSKQINHNNAFCLHGQNNNNILNMCKKTATKTTTPTKISCRDMIVLSSIVICSGSYGTNILSNTTDNNKCLLEEQKQKQVIKNYSSVDVELSTNRISLKKVWNKLKRWYESMKQACVILLRGAEITALSLPLLSIFAPLAHIEHQYFSNTKVMDDLCWRYAISIIEYLGPGYIKLAQWASTRRDLFSPMICNKLSKLQCSARTHKWKYTHDALVKSFGADYASKGLLITSQSPILGSGAVAQVYKGYLLHYGPVAIKVLHPNVSYHIENDLHLLQCIGNFLQSYILPNEMKPCMDIPTITSNMSHVLRSQVDLTVESENLITFHENFSNNQAHENIRINFPLPVKDWVSSTVLVEDLIIDAKPISSFVNNNNSKNNNNNDVVSRKRLAQPLFNAFLKMLFVDNFLHCDLHPGNILVSTATNKSKNNNSAVISNSNKYFYNNNKVLNESNSPTTTITLLDAGLTHQLSKKDFQNLKDLFLAIVLNDGMTAGKLMISRARNNQQNNNYNKQPSPNDIKQFSIGIQDIVSDFHNQKLESVGSKLTLNSIQIGSLLTRVLDLCRKYKVEMDPVMVNVVVSTIVLEGLGRSLDPDLDLMDCALPFLIEATTTSTS